MSMLAIRSRWRACYYEQGADELVFYDITASNERRGIMIEVVREVAREIFIPFTVGGGLRTLEDMRAVLLAGAEKVSIDSGAVRNPEVITQGARAFGSQCIVLSMQVKKTGVRPELPSGYEVVIDGGRLFTGKDARRLGATGRAAGRGRVMHQFDRSRRHQPRLRNRTDPRDQRRGVDSGNRFGRRGRTRASAPGLRRGGRRCRDRCLDGALRQVSNPGDQALSSRARSRSA